MRELFTIAIFKIKADIRMNKTTLNSQKEKHSLLSLRRATSVALPGLRLHLDFYPRSPCGERHFPAALRWKLCYFYPRSPCGERPTAMLLTFLSVKFLSTLSLRRATHVCCALAFFFLYFYPRSPCGERQTSLMLPCRALIFLSTLSLRRATVAAIASTFTFPLFLSTLSLRRATLLLSLSFCPLVNFYPRSPCGERPATPRAGR